MIPLVIVLIIIGAAIIILSCFMVDKAGNVDDIYSTLINQRELSLTEIEDIKKKIDNIVSIASEDITVKTDDRLSQISNEKIIAVNDFSNQLLEKINQNHEEVVFLYNMLNEKESELKNLIKDIDKTKKQINESNIKEVVLAKENPTSNKKNINNNKNISNNSNINNINIDNNSIKEVQTYNPIDNGDITNNHNKKILELYSQGFSVIDISKTLELGQGEVKLVIDLYKEK